MERIKLNIQKFADKNTIEVELLATTNELLSSITKVADKLNDLKGKVEGAKKETHSFKDVAKELQKAFAGINVSAITNQIKRLGKSLYNDFLTKAIDTSEELNLFNVVFNNISENGKKSFSELGKQATGFQKKLNEAFGTNLKETMRYQGLFQAMGESAGLSDTTANLMSENMTKLAYDLASLYNTTETRAAEALRAGVYAGQTKPLRNYGIDVTQTSFKPIMEELGLEKSVNELTQAEKEILRYISTLKQAKNAMGDFANTIESPANQLKILRQQFYEMQAAIGNLFVGAFARILPYANAIIMTIKEVAKAIAGFFGIELEDFNSGVVAYAEDLSDYEDAIGGVGASADDTAGSIKALKRQVLGFDQINNLTSPTPSSGSGGGGGAGGGILGGIDEKLLAAIKGYDNGMDKVRMKANDIKDKMMEILGFTRDINGEWEWGGFSQFVSNFSKWFGDLDFKGKALTVVGIATAFASLLKVIKGFGKLTGLTSLFKAIGSAIGGSGAAAGGAAAGSGAAAGGGAAAAGGATVGGIASGIGIAIAAVAVLATAITGAEVSFEHFRDKIANLFEGENWNFEWLDALQLGLMALSVKITPIAGAFLTIRTIIEGFQPVIKRTHISDVLDLAGASEKTKKTLGVVLKDFEDFTRNLNTIAALQKTTNSNGILGAVISQENVDELKRLFNDATTVTTTSLEEQRTGVLNNLASIKQYYRDDYDGIVETINSAYDKQIQDANDANNQISEILDTAMKRDGVLTQEEMNKINEIRAKAGSQAITNLSDSEAEMLAIRATIGEKAKNLNLTQAEEILKKSAETKNKTIEDANTQYETICKEAEKLKAAGLINDEQYKAMRSAAEETRDKTVREAERQHQEIYNEFAAQNEDVAKYIDEDTGQIIPKWKYYLNNIQTAWDGLLGNLKASIYNTLVPDMEKAGEELSKAVQEGIDNEPDPNIEVSTDEAKEIQDKLNNEIMRVSGSIHVGVNTPSAWEIQQSLETKIKNAAYNINLALGSIFGKASGGVFANGKWQPIQAYANGGVPSGGQLFMAREAGPELVGKIGRHTAVMNNNQIVDSVKAGVYEAVSAAMSEGGMGSVQIDLHTDEGVVVDRINRITRQTGNCPIEI